VGQLVQKGQCHGFALWLWQNLESASYGRTTLLRDQLVGDFWCPVGQLLEQDTVRVHLRFWPRPPSAQLVDDPAASDLNDPRPEAAPPRIERGRSLPDREEHVLDDLFGSGPIQVSRGQVCKQWAITRMKGVQCITPTLGESLHQLFVWNGL
jgi:hypothetical protein